MHFRGHLKMYLDDKDTARLIKRTVLTGQWLTETKRILSKPRKFKVNLYLVNTEGNKAHSSITMLQKGTIEDLCDVVMTYAQEIVDESPWIDFDVENSYAVIKA